MRRQGEELTDQGLVELNLMSGHVSWVNRAVLEKCGYTLDQVQSLTVFDLFPEDFHDGLRNTISDQTKGKFHKFSIWPWREGGGKVVWWYSVRVKAQHPLYWFRFEYLNTTGETGADYASMRAAMETTNGYNDLFNKIADLQNWTEENIDRLGHETQDLRDAVSGLKEQMRSTLSAANKAANAALENAQTINSFKEDISKELSNHTAEILRLITTDTIHDKRIEAFESHMKATTSKAVTAIQVQAEKSGRGLARKVTIPVGTIAAIATLVQWLIQHWPHK